MGRRDEVRAAMFLGRTMDFSAEQALVWGRHDPDTYGCVVERLKAREAEMLERMEKAIQNGAPVHTVAWIAVQFVLNGRAGESAHAPTSGPAINNVPVGA